MLVKSLQKSNLRRPSSVFRFRFGVSAWFVASLMGSVFAQVSTEVTAMQIAPGRNQATIIVKRRPGLFGQDGTRYVIDRGAGMVRDAIIVEDTPFPDNVGNFCLARNVVYFSSTRPEPLAPNSAIQNISAVIIGRSPRANLEPNAALVGKFDARGIITWTRPPGRMRLEIVKANGNQSVCAPIEVEAGKTYEITIHYGDRTRFEIKALPASNSAGGSANAFANGASGLVASPIPGGQIPQEKRSCGNVHSSQSSSEAAPEIHEQ